MNMKKLISLALALVLMLAMAVPAFAEAVKNGTITIENPVKDATYSIYKIFDLESYSGTAYSYRISKESEWNAFVTGTGAGAAYVNVDENGYVTWKEDKKSDADVAEFAKLALAYAQEKPITPTDSVKKAGDTVEFTGLELGYYLVDSSVGALCGLNTTQPNATIKEKNKAPENEKEVQEDSNENWGETNDADVGQIVNFKSTITAEAGAQNYIFHDKMSEGLTFDSTSVDVTYVTYENAEKQEVTLTAGTDYTLVTAPTDECTFEVVFDQTFCANLKAGEQIVITYSAVLNEKAVVGVEGNPNASYISYGEDNEHKTTPSDTTTYTWAMNVVKVNEQETKLAGAKFTLTRKSDNALMKFSIAKDKDGNEIANTYVVDPNGNITEITTDSTGTFHIIGLDADTYYLTETQAPAGYNKIETPIEVVVKAGETDAEGTYLATEAKVINKTGTELPSTGGMGTTILYVAGSLLVAAAVVLLIVKRRMNAAE